MRKHILVVDDDEAVRESLSNLLQESGYAVVLASDGQQGASRLEAGAVDLLVLDLNLPKLSGWDLLDLAQELHPALPVLVLTGLADQCEPGALAGAVLMEKPPDVKLLLTTIERLLAEGGEELLKRLGPGNRHSRQARPAGSSYLRLPNWPDRWSVRIQPGRSSVQ